MPFPFISSYFTFPGITYDSECHLLRSKCLSYDSPLANNNLTILHRGSCSPDDIDEEITVDGIKRKKSNLCAKTHCPFFAICKEIVPGITSCHCPECRADQRPVCGSDGTTYQNECYVRKASCEASNTIEILYEGHCDPSNGQSNIGQGIAQPSCDGMKCPPYATCEINMYGDPECICPSVCLRIDSPVCGSDGKTYENECEVRIKSCKIQSHINIIHRGQCGKCLQHLIKQFKIPFTTLMKNIPCL